MSEGARAREGGGVLEPGSTGQHVPYKVPPRFELGLPDSESSVLTVTLRDRGVASRVRTCACEDHTVDLKSNSLTNSDIATIYPPLADVVDRIRTCASEEIRT